MKLVEPKFECFVRKVAKRNFWPNYTKYYTLNKNNRKLLIYIDILRALFSAGPCAFNTTSTACTDGGPNASGVDVELLKFYDLGQPLCSDPIISG